MCNLYTLAPWEVRHLIQHYRLIGRDFEEVMRGCNETLDVYPNRRADKQPFFFARIWRPWTGDRGTKKSPNIGDHTLFSIMTTEPNAVVEPIHEKAMPVMLMTPDDVEQWLGGGSVEDALKMQKPASDDAIVIRPDEKKAA